MANGRCKNHGGLSPTGSQAGRTTHGRYSRDLPTRLAADFAAGQTDPDLLSLRSEIALTDSRLADLVRMVDVGESGELWKALGNAYRAAEAKRAVLERAKGTEEESGARGDFFVAFEHVGVLISEGIHDRALWDEIAERADDRRKLVETEAKRLKDLQQMVSADQAAAFVRAVVGAVQRHASPEAQAAIGADLSALVGQMPHPLPILSIPERR